MSSSEERIEGEILEPVAVLGAGVEGRATLEYLLGHGVLDVTVLDAKPVDGLPKGARTRFARGYDEDLDRFATVFRSPGIRPDNPGLVRARRAGTTITSALSFFLERCPCDVVAFTGTVGKGTASSIAAAAIAAGGLEVCLGGNIGTNPLEFLDDLRPLHRVVLEVSSFQAMDLRASPRVAVILKTTSEHLDWHLDTAEYRAAKAALLRHQRPGDVVVYCADSPGAAEIAARSPGRKRSYSLERPVEDGLYLRDSSFVLVSRGVETILPLDTRKVALPGRFNLENIAAGVLAALEVGAKPAAATRAAAEFRSLPHRLELVVEARGISFYNDSYATRPEATIAAAKAFSGRPLSLVLGGSEKNADFSELVAALLENPDIVRVSLIGATAARLERALVDPGVARFEVARCQGLEEAMEVAARGLLGGSVLLMSPACASFGLFENYKARGERFRELAREMARRLGNPV